MKTQLKILASLLLVGLASVLVCGTAQTEKMGTVISTGIIPAGVAVDPSLNRMYIMGSGVLGILDGATHSFTTVETGISPRRSFPGQPSPGEGFQEVIAVNPVNHRVYLLGASELGIFNGVSQTLVHRLPLGGLGADYLTVNPTTDTVYIVVHNRLVIVDGETLSISTVELPNIGSAVGVACNTETNQIYVPVGLSLVVIDGATLQVTATIELGTFHLWGIAVNPVTNKIYLPANTSPDNRFVLIVVDGVTLEVSHSPINQYPLDLEPIAVGPVLIYSPLDIAMDPASDSMYIPALTFPFNKRLLVEIDGRSNRHKRILPTGFETFAIAVNPDSGLAYLAGFVISGKPQPVYWSVLIIQVNPVGGVNAE
jgi:DNA-binding beta-propeller fold protein YncE